jgi:hypothetical protein
VELEDMNGFTALFYAVPKANVVCKHAWEDYFQRTSSANFVKLFKLQAVVEL